MRFLFALVLLLAATISFGQPKTLGKTEAQILAMGRDKWADFHAEKAGTSTADMCEAAYIYGTTLKNRNDRLLRDNLDGDWKMKLESLRKLLTKYASSSIDLGYAFSGGGTMWNPVYASVETEVETILYQMLTAKGPKQKPMVVSAVTKQHDKLAAAITKESGTSSSDWFKAGEAKKSLAGVRATYKKIVAIAGTLQRGDSDRVLGFCYQYAQTASGN